MQRWGNLVLSQFKASKFQAEYYHVFEVQYTGCPHTFELLALFRSLSGPIHLFRWSPFSFTTPINPPQSWLREVHLTLQEQKEALRTQQHPWIHPGSHLPSLSAILTVSLHTSISLKCCSEMMSSCCREWCGPGAIYTQLNMVPSTVKERCLCESSFISNFWTSSSLPSYLPHLPSPPCCRVLCCRLAALILARIFLSDAWKLLMKCTLFKHWVFL